MAIDPPADLLGSLLSEMAPVVGLGLVGVTALLLLPRLIDDLRQRAYERAVADEVVRLEIRPPAGSDLTADGLVELVRGLHPRHRRGVDPIRVGWPTLELRIVARAGVLAWQVEAPRGVLPAIVVALRTQIPDVELEPVGRDEAPATASATGRLTAPARWPLRAADDPAGSVTARLAAAVTDVPPAAEVRYRVRIRPVSAERWRAAIDPDATTTSVAGLVGRAAADALLLRPTAQEPRTPRTPSVAEREAGARKRAGVVGFSVGVALEVGGVPHAQASALLQRLSNATDSAGSAHQSIRWHIHRGRTGVEPGAVLADWEVAALWSLPTAPLDRGLASRRRPLAAPPPPPGSRGLVVAQSSAGPVALAPDVLLRHLAVIGATGSGKSTLLLTLLTEAARTGIGATLIDPHGDLVDDVLARVPAAAAGRVAVLRLADRAHPRGFNFLERRSVDEAQLVTSEFVDMLEDLWPRFCGPKMQHYLRHALLTLLSAREPQTVLELVRLLTDDGFRQAYTDRLADPLLAAFWRNEWPGPRERERDTSIKAVLNKLGAFVAYEQIRHVVGQGTSTITPRRVMDDGRLLLVDLSRVGGDNASLFGAMAISRYYIDAVGRQGTPMATRRPHLLIVDEAQRFDTRALGRIAVEGRKFGLGLVLASQSLAGLGERLRGTILTNAASLALLAPGHDDVRAIARLFAPLTPDRLADLRRFELVLRTPGADGGPIVVGGLVRRPGGEDSTTLAAIMAASDARDARPAGQVRAEVHRRAGGDRPTASDASQTGLQ
jgi:hypothetical protein